MGAKRKVGQVAKEANHKVSRVKYVPTLYLLARARLGVQLYVESRVAYGASDDDRYLELFKLDANWFPQSIHILK